MLAASDLRGTCEI